MSEIDELKKKVAMACRMLFVAELVDYSGHISVRIPGTDKFLIHGHPVSRCEVTPDDVVTVNRDGKVLEGKWKAPSELPMHIRTYLARSDVQSVAHLHNRMVVVLTMAGRPLIPADNPGALFGPGALPVYPDPALIHTNEQGDAVARVLGKRDAAMLRGHGSLVVGQSIEWTFAACVDLEESAARTCLASTLGPISYYTDDELDRVGKGRRKMSVIQKVWDHYVAKTRQAGLMAGI
ncbi:MAG TPA: class II aldolase/adducin family protein [Candidatus Binatia bacterium]